MKTLSFVSIILFSAFQYGFGQIQVSEIFSEIMVTREITTHSRRISEISIPVPNPEDTYYLQVKGTGESNLVIRFSPTFKDRFDTIRVDTTRAKNEFIDRRNSEAQFKIKPEPFDDSIKVLILNRGYTDASVNFLAVRFGIRDSGVTNQIKSYVWNLVNAFAAFYKFDSPITIRPCYEANAFYMDTIIVCGELISELFRTNRFEAINFIIYHEIGHYVMKEYGLPGFDNEDLADEFALVFLGQHDKKGMEKSLEYFSAMKESIEDQVILKIYGLNDHPLSSERIIRIKRKLSKIGEY